MSRPEFNGARNLKVEFTDVRYGLIHFRMTLGEKSYETNFSDVFDPLLRFKHWLEAIAIGVDQCSFSFDPEGDEIKFDLARVSWDKEVFTVSFDYGDEEPFLSDYVDRRQLVEAFYLGLLEFYDTSNLLRENWEVEYMHERLSGSLNLEYESLVEELASLERNELKVLLFKAAPKYLLSCPSAPPDKAWGYLIDDFMGNIIPPEHPIVRTPIEWNIEEDFDDWTPEKKRELVRECLSEKANEHEGTKISLFRSAIIADYLGLSSSIEIKECIA